jgi:hypothetical protein
MKQRVSITLLLASILLFSGCGESQKEHDAKVAKAAREALMKELKAKEDAEQKALLMQEKNSQLSAMGLQKYSDGKIIIDMNKTKNYFTKLATKMKSKIKAMNQEIESGNLQEQDAGIEINQTHINIDLNKTQHFLDNFGKKMQGYVKEFEGMVQELNNTK